VLIQGEGCAQGRQGGLYRSDVTPNWLRNCGTHPEFSLELASGRSRGGQTGCSLPGGRSISTGTDIEPRAHHYPGRLVRALRSWRGGFAITAAPGTLK